MSAPRWISVLRSCCDVRRSLPVYAVLALGVALSVFVLAWLLALRQGFVTTLAASGRADQALVLSRSATMEAASFLRFDQGLALAQHGAIARLPDGTPLASAEIFAISYLDLGPAELVSVTVRGLSPAGAALRRGLRLTQGRMFEPGARELLVGAALQRRWPQLTVGRQVKVRGADWTIVGRFDTGDAAQSELWADVNSVQNAFRLKGFQSVLARFGSDADLQRFRADLARDASLNVAVLSERDYYARNSTVFPRAVGLIALLVGTVMACAAAVNASNSMLYLVERRRHVTALILAIGFEARSVYAATLAEAALVAGAGALLGWAAAYAALDGRSVSTINTQSYEMVAFTYSIGWTQGGMAFGLAAVAVLVGVVAAAAKLALTPIVRMLAKE